jgi:selenocysteine lyase/cysteine desulfurase
LAVEDDAGVRPLGLTPGLSVRDEFPIFEHTTYANSCSQGALANRVRAAAEEWLAGWDEHGAEWAYWVERNEAAREAFARLVGAEPDDVAVTTSVSQAVSALVSALDLTGERNRIVIGEYEFPTVGQIAHAQELRGAEVVHVLPDADGRIPLERFAEAIDERTALVCSTFVSFRSGHRHDVPAIAELAHASGAIHLADSYQALGAIEVDVRTFGADVVTGGTVKYLLGSAGLGFMWLRESLHSALLPTQTGWFADEDIFAMSIADYSPHATARRFDSGTPPVPSLYPGVAGMELIMAVGVPAIESHIRRLADRLLAGLDELGATVVTPRGETEYGPLLCVLSTDPNALVDTLAADRIVVSTRDSNVRISLHLYNVEDDVDRILASLAANAALLA